MCTSRLVLQPSYIYLNVQVIKSEQRGLLVLSSIDGAEELLELLGG